MFEHPLPFIVTAVLGFARQSVGGSRWFSCPIDRRSRFTTTVSTSAFRPVR